MIMQLTIEAVMATLLVVTIAYCYRLHRHLSVLREEQEALSDLITGLNQATTRAQDGVFQLRSFAQEAEENLKRECTRARALADELSVITEAGSNLADRIDAGLGAVKAKSSRPAPATGPVAGSARPVRPVSPGISDFPVKETSGDQDIRHALRAAR
ncbi:MAG: DUF6468 domain-containing protein [Sphingomonadales bacterium]